MVRLRTAVAKRWSLGLVTGFTVGLLTALGLVVPVDSSEPGRSSTMKTSLHPGDNFVGWVADPLPLDRLFDDLPEVELVYRWNPRTELYDYAMPGVNLSETPLDELAAGTSAVLTIGSEALSVDDLFQVSPHIALLYRWDTETQSWLFALRYIPAAHWTLDVLDAGTSVTVRMGAGSVPTSSLFKDVPQIASVHRHDPTDDSLAYAMPGLNPAAGGLEVLQPGMAIMIRIGGDSPVEWEQPLGPVRGSVQLYEGENWVSWAGQDGWTIEQATKGVGRSLVRAQHGGLVFEPGETEDVSGWETVDRADALQITASRPLTWLQPTGLIPEIRIPESLPTELGAFVLDQVQAVLNFFAFTFGVQADASVLQIFVSDERCGWAAPSGRLIVMGTPDQCTDVRYTLSHEYFHAVQTQLSATSRSEAQWLVEGAALWAEARHAMHDGRRDYFGSRQERAATAVDRGPNLNGFDPPFGGYGGADPYPGYMYSLGFAAVDLLLARGEGIDILEFYRNLGSQSVGSPYELPPTPDWESAFDDTFGISVDRFYDDFDKWRDSRPRRTMYRGEIGDRLFTGRVLHQDKTPVSEELIYVYHEEGGWPRGTETDASGRFRVFVPTAEKYKAVVSLPQYYACRSGYASEELSLWSLDSELFLEFHASELQSGQIVLPFDQCPYRISGALVDASGSGLVGQVAWVEDIHSGLGFGRVLTNSDGAFDIYVPSNGQYRIGVESASCSLYWRGSGPTGTWYESESIHVSNSDVVGIVFRVPEDPASVCRELGSTS